MFEDPHTPGEKRYECLACMQRIVSEDSYGACPNCGGRLRNIAVPRE